MYMDTKPCGGSSGRKGQSPVYRKEATQGKIHLQSFSINLKKQRGGKPSFMPRRSAYLSPLAAKGGFITGFLLPLLSFCIHYSIILSAGTTNSLRTLHHLSPTISKTGPSKPWPVPHSQPRAWPQRLELMLMPQLVDRQTASRDTRDQASRASQFLLPSFCASEQILSTHGGFSRAFLPTSPIPLH